MLIVTDLQRLQDYGFTTKGYTNKQGNTIYTKTAYRYDDPFYDGWLDQIVEFIVNPLEVERKVPKNELVVQCCTSCSTKGVPDYIDIESMFNVDIIVQMIADGVLKLVREGAA